MELDDKTYIEKYLLKKLSSEENRSFETRLDNDSAFKKLYLKEKAFINLVDQEANKDLKQFLQNIENNTGHSHNPKTNNKLKSYILSALVLILLLIGGLWYFGQQTSNNSTQIFAEHFELYPNTLADINRGDDDLENLQEVMLDYLEKDHTNAIKGFDKLLKSQENDKISFYRALSLLRTDNNTQAINELNRLHKVSGFELSDATKWYLGLAYLKIKDTKNARILFQDIVDSNQKYQRTASLKILNLLN